jgi:hypothetical protein
MMGAGITLINYLTDRFESQDASVSAKASVAAATPQRNTRDFETTVSDCGRLETGDGWLTVVRARAEQTADEQERTFSVNTEETEMAVMDRLSDKALKRGQHLADLIGCEGAASG